MKKSADMRIFFTLLTAVTISGFIVICTLGQKVHSERVEAKLSSVIETERPSDIITVREYDGRVCVFIGESPAPYRTLDVDVSLLSDYDRELLREGIRMESEADLRRFIEDIST